MSLTQKLLRTKAISNDMSSESGLKRVLGAFDLTLLGIGAIIGAGIFVLSGITAATQSGPAVILSFVVAGFACGCAALSYAEMASTSAQRQCLWLRLCGAGRIPGMDHRLDADLRIFRRDSGGLGRLVRLCVGFPHDWGVGLPDSLTHTPFDPKTPGLINLPAFLIVAVLGACWRWAPR